MTPFPAFVVDVTLQGTVVLLGAVAAARLLRNRSAALRHCVWSLALGSLLLLPVLRLFGTGWEFNWTLDWEQVPVAEPAAAEHGAASLPAGSAAASSAPVLAVCQSRRSCPRE